MDEQTMIRARDAYREWVARPWYVKLWDRVRSETGYAASRLVRRRVRRAP